MSFTSFRSTRKVVVVDRFGRPTGEERILSNSPIDALFPDEKIVMVNWKYEGAKAPTAEELRRPIRHGGDENRGDWASRGAGRVSCTSSSCPKGLRPWPARWRTASGM